MVFFHKIWVLYLSFNLHYRALYGTDGMKRSIAKIV
jgi:hypothetical protein